MSQTRLIVRTPDDRQLDVLVDGPGDGLPLLFHAGTPGGLVAPPPVTGQATARGLRTVMYSRPGYGGSTPMPGRRVADCAADVAAVLDHLGVERFVTAGWSGGGPHALACAALLPDRCLAAASVAGVAPYGAEGLDWLAGMAEENLAEFAAAQEGEAALTGFLAVAENELREITGPEVAASLGGLVDEADTAVLTGEFADYLAASSRAALSSGVAGWRDDDLAFVADWGFELPAGNSVPTAVWQGGQDRMVPAGHGSWLGSELAAARVHLLPADGHLTLITGRFGDIADDLLDLAGMAPGSPR
jgi:pimeloyl-ACP methyl ester carboxylesterase